MQELCVWWRASRHLKVTRNRPLWASTRVFSFPDEILFLPSRAAREVGDGPMYGVPLLAKPPGSSDLHFSSCYGSEAERDWICSTLDQISGQHRLHINLFYLLSELQHKNTGLSVIICLTGLLTQVWSVHLCLSGLVNKQILCLNYPDTTTRSRWWKCVLIQPSC